MGGFKSPAPVAIAVERTRVPGPNEIVLLGCCEGLEGEAQAVYEAIADLEPDSVALSLGPQVASHVHELAPEGRLGVEDEAYARGLSRWGEVRLPAPEHWAAIDAAGEVDAEVVGVDIPEGEYLDRYTATIGILDLTRRALRIRWMKTFPPSADDPVVFCRRFDERANKGPFGELEADREQRMAEGVAELAKEGRVVHIVPVPRMDGVASALKTRTSKQAIEA